MVFAPTKATVPAAEATFFAMSNEEERGFLLAALVSSLIIDAETLGIIISSSLGLFICGKISMSSFPSSEESSEDSSSFCFGAVFLEGVFFDEDRLVSCAVVVVAIVVDDGEDDNDEDILLASLTFG